MNVQAAYATLDAAYEEHQPALVFALFSGGHDSLTATAIAQEWARDRGMWVPVAHINTGTGIKQTHDFVVDTASEHGWPLIELHPPRSYRSLVLEMGFPGPGFHDRMAYPRLKERCLRNLERMAPAGERVMLVTGIRSEESERRMEHVEEVQVRERRIWAAAIWDWTKTDCNHFLAEREFKRNEVSDLLHISGECLCGAFAKKVELAEIARWFPEKAAEIRALEDEVERRGIRGCRWGKRPPGHIAREQERLFLTPNDGSIPMLCVGCGHDDEEAENGTS